MLKTVTAAGKKTWALVNLFYKGMGAIILLLISIACPPIGVCILCAFLYYIYKHLTKL